MIGRLATNGALTSIVVSALVSSCAQISVSSSVKLVPGEGPPRQLEAEGSVIADRRYVASWIQAGDKLRVSLREERSCKALVHTPVVRVETIHYRPDSTLWWEYLLGGGLAGFSAFAFTRPEMFGTRYISETGTVVYDSSAGRRVGTVFAVFGGILLTSAVYDTIRSIDRTTYADAYRVDVGPSSPCVDPVAPLVDQAVELVVDDYRIAATTDRGGLAEFALPPRSARRPDVADTIRIRRAAVQVDATHAVAVDYRTPYDVPGPPHSGPADKRLDLLSPTPQRARPGNDVTNGAVPNTVAKPPGPSTSTSPPSNDPSTNPPSTSTLITLQP